MVGYICFDSYLFNGPMEEEANVIKTFGFSVAIISGLLVLLVWFAGVLIIVGG